MTGNTNGDRLNHLTATVETHKLYIISFFDTIHGLHQLQDDTPGWLENLDITHKNGLLTSLLKSHYFSFNYFIVLFHWWSHLIVKMSMYCILLLTIQNIYSSLLMELQPPPCPLKLQSINMISLFWIKSWCPWFSSQTSRILNLENDKLIYFCFQILPLHTIPCLDS